MILIEICNRGIHLLFRVFIPNKWGIYTPFFLLFEHIYRYDYASYNNSVRGREDL
jgi:hypothetical protein